jgi:hypothetical protein
MVDGYVFEKCHMYALLWVNAFIWSWHVLVAWLCLICGWIAYFDHMWPKAHLVKWENVDRCVSTCTWSMKLKIIKFVDPRSRGRMLDVLVDLKSAKPHGRSLSRASAHLPVIGRQTLSPLGSAPCLQRHYIREETPWATLTNPPIGFPSEILLYQLVRALEGSEARAPPARHHRRRPEGHRHRGYALALHQLVSSSTLPPHRVRPMSWTPPLPV